MVARISRRSVDATLGREMQNELGLERGEGTRGGLRSAVCLDHLCGRRQGLAAWMTIVVNHEHCRASCE
jgi:hypothetical protein